MMKRLPLFFALAALTIFSGCGAGEPDKALVGSWGLDVTVVEEEGKKLADPLAARIHTMKLEALRGMRLTLSADGVATMTGAQGDQRGRYTIDAVDGDKVTVTITYDGSPPDTTLFEVHSSDRVTMIPGDRTVTLPLLRR